MLRPFLYICWSNQIFMEKSVPKMWKKAVFNYKKQSENRASCSNHHLSARLSYPYSSWPAVSPVPFNHRGPAVNHHSAPAIFLWVYRQKTTHHIKWTFNRWGFFHPPLIVSWPNRDNNKRLPLQGAVQPAKVQMLYFFPGHAQNKLYMTACSFMSAPLNSKIHSSG